jgi:hypothetical protein
MTRALFHYTCDHGRAALGRAGFAVPIRTHSPTAAAQLPEELAWMAELVWFTDQRHPDPVALGLTRATIDCDRTRFRYRVTDPAGIDPWLTVTRSLPRAAWKLTQGDARPGQGWVARGPVPVELDA